MRGAQIATVAAAVLCVLPTTAPAAPNVQKVFDDYIHSGRVHACWHTIDSLRLSREGMPQALQKYAPDFDRQVQEAVQVHEQGQCGPEAAISAPAQPVAPSTGMPPTGATTPPASISAHATSSGNAISRTASNQGTASAFPSVLAIVFSALAIALGSAILVLAMLLRRPRIGHGRLVTWQHSLAEADYRVRGRWEDFRDWMHLGR